MGCSMVNDIRLIAFDNIEDSLSVLYICDDRDQFDILRNFRPQFSVDCIYRIFTMAQQQNARWLEIAYLSADFRTDGSARPGNHDRFAFQFLFYCIHIEFDFFPAQNIFNFHIPDIIDRDFAQHQIFNSGYGLRFDTGIDAELGQLGHFVA